MDEARAVRAFEAVAKAMSPGERASIRGYWFDHDGAPFFAVEDTFYFETARDDGPFRALGMNVSGEGLAFRFAGRAMHYMANILVETLIAHEIAHAVIAREIRENELPEEDAASYHQLTLDLAAKAEGIEDDAELLKIVRANYGAISEWTEAAVNRRIKSWNEKYDDQLALDLLKYYLEHGNPPPPPEPDLAPEGEAEPQTEAAL